MEKRAQDLIELEKMVDSHGLTEVLYMLAEICGEKADHIRANYNPKDRDAVSWDKSASVISNAAGKVQ